jgi:SHS2 domain-containing protein
MNSPVPHAEDLGLGQTRGYFEHDADMGIMGWGTSVEQAFESAAQAVFSIVTALESMRASNAVAIEFEEADFEFALVTWLNLLLGKSRELGMVFCRFRVQHQGDHWHTETLGEKWRSGLVRGRSKRRYADHAVSQKNRRNMGSAVRGGCMRRAAQLCRRHITRCDGRCRSLCACQPANSYSPGGDHLYTSVSPCRT